MVSGGDRYDPLFVTDAYERMKEAGPILGEGHGIHMLGEGYAITPIQAVERVRVVKFKREFSQAINLVGLTEVFSCQKNQAFEWILFPLEKVSEKQVDLPFVELVEGGFLENFEGAGRGEMKDDRVVGLLSRDSPRRSLSQRGKGSPLALASQGQEKEDGEEEEAFHLGVHFEIMGGWLRYFKAERKAARRWGLGSDSRKRPSREKRMDRGI